jgi:hypothetical protein
MTKIASAECEKTLNGAHCTCWHDGDWCCYCWTHPAIDENGEQCDENSSY